MTLDVKPEIAAALETLAFAKGGHLVGLLFRQRALAQN
jgi:hypothetical protein